MFLVAKSKVISTVIVRTLLNGLCGSVLFAAALLIWRTDAVNLVKREPAISQTHSFVKLTPVVQGDDTSSLVFTIPSPNRSKLVFKIMGIKFLKQQISAYDFLAYPSHGHAP